MLKSFQQRLPAIIDESLESIFRHPKGYNLKLSWNWALSTAAVICK